MVKRHKIRDKSSSLRFHFLSRDFLNRVSLNRGSQPSPWFNSLTLISNSIRLRRFNTSLNHSLRHRRFKRFRQASTSLSLRRPRFTHRRIRIVEPVINTIKSNNALHPSIISAFSRVAVARPILILSEAVLTLDFLNWIPVVYLEVRWVADRATTSEPNLNIRFERTMENRLSWAASPKGSTTDRWIFPQVC